MIDLKIGDEKTPLLRKKKFIGTYLDYDENLRTSPYTTTGYRINYNLKDCAISLFQWHNETTNIWSHLFGSILFLIAIVVILTQWPNMNAEASKIML